MKRREFIVVVAAAAFAPFSVAAQPKVARIGFLSVASDVEPHLRLLRISLRELGYVEGRTLQLEVQAVERSSLLAEGAAQLVKAKVEAIVTVRTPATLAAKQATSTIPIVFFAVGDPVGTGLVSSLNRPGANVTGIGTNAPEASAKTLELLREALPSTRRVAVLIDPSDPFSKSLLEQLDHIGKARSIEIQPVAVKNHDALDAAISALARSRPDAAFIQSSLPLRTVDLLLKQRVPSGATSDTFADAGCLVTYAIDTADTCRKAAGYVDRILKGSKPADLPVEAPKRNLIVNQKTARALGLTVPHSVLLRADKVIE